jgi:hypothetical protein
MRHRLPYVAVRRVLAGFSVVLVLGAAPVSAHGPDPIVGGALWNQDQVVTYRWKVGQEPPTWLRAEVHAAAADSNASSLARAADYDFDGGARSVISYDEPSGCGTNGIACFNRSGAPVSFTMAFRRQGYVFDWGTLRWCQAYVVWPDGCYDVENIALDEFGHVQVLSHHVNYADGTDYLDAVVQTYSRTKPRSGWNVHDYGRCDVATLQRKYDIPSSWTKLSTCLGRLDTTLAIAASDTSIAYRGSTTMTATLRVTTSSSYELLSGDLLSGRDVYLQRRPLGSTTWTTIGEMAAGSKAGTYLLSVTSTATGDWRAIMWAPDGDGIDGGVSPALRVTVAACTSACPTSIARR